MTLHSETDIYRSVTDLQKFALRAAVNFRRDAKPILGARLVDETLWMSVLVRRANIARDADKVPHLEELLEQLEITQSLLRLGRDLDLIPNNTFAQSVPLTASIGKQAIALRNHFAPAPSPVT